MNEGYFQWSDPIYWLTSCAGYTGDASMAGIYSAEDVEDAGGCKGDWLLEPLSRKELREANDLPPLTGMEPFEMPERLPNGFGA
mgnify:FL=1|tara:strand:- start:1573 stop:1824 length:252 start_codon:yes stop_codon:yes gene_type:complete